MWGQHPALSYYDHPPLNAWLLGLSSAMFGWNVFALRFAHRAGLPRRYCSRCISSRAASAADWRGHFWLTLLLFLATPIFSMVTNYALPDHILLTGAAVRDLLLPPLLRGSRRRRQPARRATCCSAALFLGLAGLAKYNAAFLGLGVGAVRPALRPRAAAASASLSGGRHRARAAGARSSSGTSPERFASFEFQLRRPPFGTCCLARRPAAAADRHSASSSAPFLLWPIGRFVVLAPEPYSRVSASLAPRSPSRRMAIVALAFVTLTLFHWNLVAYAAMLPFLAAYMRPRWLIPLQALWGTSFAVAIFINYSIMPITNVSGWRMKRRPGPTTGRPSAQRSRKRATSTTRTSSPASTTPPPHCSPSPSRTGTS